MRHLGSLTAFLAMAASIGCAAGSPPDGSVGGTGSSGSSSSTTAGTGGHGTGGNGTGGHATTGTGGGSTGGGGGSTTAGTGGQGTGGTGGGASKCGNGVVDIGEQCDGANLAGRSCGTEGFTGGSLECNPDCTLNTALCGECNDGTIEPSLGEDCDFDGVGNPIVPATCASLGFSTPGKPGCAVNCKYDLVPCECGDGMIEGSEACDGADLNGHTCATEGFTAGTIACDATCKVDTSGCTKCGNGVVEAGEQCDGADLGGQTCVTEGFASGMLACDGACHLVTSGCTRCGNGVVDPGEQCDGGDLGGETCASLGFTAGTLSCGVGCTLSTSACTKCGNGILEPGEQCDDGNTMSGDGCSSTCQIESGGPCDPDGVWTITGGPVAYTCCSGNVDVSVGSFVFSGAGATIDSSPSDPVTMTGAATTCPTGSFSDTGSIPGGCAEHYTVSGMFTGPDAWTGTYKLTFVGSQCSCFGGALGTPCVNQTFAITATR